MWAACNKKVTRQSRDEGLLGTKVKNILIPNCGQEEDWELVKDYPPIGFFCKKDLTMSWLWF